MEPTQEQEVAMIEDSIKKSKARVALAESLNKLLKNKDFKAVFLDHFMVSEVSRTVRLMADPSCQDPKQQQLFENMLIAVGQVDQFIQKTLMMGDRALNDIADSEAELEDILTNPNV